MKRLIKSVIAGAIGSAAGYAVHQMKRRQHHAASDGDAAEHADIVCAAPPANVAAATLAGLVTGKPKAAFLVGFGLSAALGDELASKLQP